MRRWEEGLTPNFHQSRPLPKEARNKYYAAPIGMYDLPSSKRDVIDDLYSGQGIETVSTPPPTYCL
jgi:hypothetical protein